MIFDKTWRLQRIECKIAGLTAKLKATREIFNACDGTVPGGIVIDMRDIPQRIAELETRAKQLKAPNGEVRGASRLAGEASSAEGATSTDVLERT